MRRTDTALVFLAAMALGVSAIALAEARPGLPDILCLTRSDAR